MDYAVVVGYLTEDGPRSASYWMCGENDVIQAMEDCIAYCKRFEIANVKIVSTDELTTEMFTQLREEVAQQINVEEVVYFG